MQARTHARVQARPGIDNSATMLNAALFPSTSLCLSQSFIGNLHRQQHHTHSMPSVTNRPHTAHITSATDHTHRTSRYRYQRTTYSASHHIVSNRPQAAHITISSPTQRTSRHRHEHMALHDIVTNRPHTAHLAISSSTHSASLDIVTIRPHSAPRDIVTYTTHLTISSPSDHTQRT